MKKAIRSVLSCAAVFFSVLIVLFIMLFAVCQIPRSAIESNCRKSAEYFAENDSFPLIVNNICGTHIDNYADSIWMNIIYNAGTDIRSVISAPYYRVDGEYATANYYDTVVNSYVPNAEYSRYWHGSQILIRPLLIIFSVIGVRAVLFLFFVILCLFAIYLLIRQKMYKAAAVYIISLTLSRTWVSLFCLEYIMCFLVMAVAVLAMILVLSKNDDKDGIETKMIRLFVIVGVAVSFFDFLTAETITFTMPIVIYILMSKERNGLSTLKQELKRVIKCGAAWVTAYAGTFIVKWMLVYTFLGKSAFLNALSNAAYRIDGSLNVESTGTDVSLFSRISGLLLRNIGCMFTFDSGATASDVIFACLCFLALFGSLFYLFCRNPIDTELIALVFFVALIPYLRLVCLSNHSYIHYFFTYRAQMPVLSAFSAALIYNIFKAKNKPISHKKLKSNRINAKRRLTKYKK